MADFPVPEEQRPDHPRGGALSERVADADRDRTVTLLREHVVEGRLTLDEFSERVGLALEAKTRGELDAVMADLPVTQPPPTAEVQPAGSRARRWHIAIMSGHSTKGRWRIGRKTNAVAVMGGCDMDLRRAEIEGQEVEITAVAFWGGSRDHRSRGLRRRPPGPLHHGRPEPQAARRADRAGITPHRDPRVRHHGGHRGQEPAQPIGGTGHPVAASPDSPGSRLPPTWPPSGGTSAGSCGSNAGPSGTSTIMEACRIPARRRKRSRPTAR